MASATATRARVGGRTVDPSPDVETTPVVTPGAPIVEDTEPEVIAHKAEPTGATGSYVVVTDAVSLSVPGRKKGELIGQRFVLGNILAAKNFPADTDWERLIYLKAVAVNDGEPKRRTNARALAQAAGGIDDPALAPSPELRPEVEAHSIDDDLDDSSHRDLLD